MKYASTLAVVGLAMWVTQAFSDEPSPWERWDSAIAHKCPDRHLEWIYGDGYLELPESFEATLSQDQRSKISEIADVGHRCGYEKMGFDCEFAASLDAYVRLGLFKRFVAFGCSHVRCEEAALCSQFPHSIPNGK